MPKVFAISLKLGTVGKAVKILFRISVKASDYQGIIVAHRTDRKYKT